MDKDEAKKTLDELLESKFWFDINELDR
jgi:hypothetical protein